MLATGGHDALLSRLRYSLATTTLQAFTACQYSDHTKEPYTVRVHVSPNYYKYNRYLTGPNYLLSLLRKSNYYFDYRLYRLPGLSLQKLTP